MGSPDSRGRWSCTGNSDHRGGTSLFGAKGRPPPSPLGSFFTPKLWMLHLHSLFLDAMLARSLSTLYDFSVACLLSIQCSRCCIFSQFFLPCSHRSCCRSCWTDSSNSRAMCLSSPCKAEGIHELTPTECSHLASREQLPTPGCIVLSCSYGTVRTKSDDDIQMHDKFLSLVFPCSASCISIKRVLYFV